MSQKRLMTKQQRLYYENNNQQKVKKELLELDKQKQHEKSEAECSTIALLNNYRI